MAWGISWLYPVVYVRYTLVKAFEVGLQWDRNIAYHIMENSCKRKHSQFESKKLVSKKLFANDKSFKLFS